MADAKLKIIIEGVDNASGPLGELSGKLKGIGDSVTGVGTKLTAGLTVPITAAATASVWASQEWAGGMDAIMDATGLANDETAGLLLTTQKYGINNEAAAKSLTIFTKGLVDMNGELGTSGKALDSMGISLYDANGELKPMETLLQETADQLSTMEDGALKTSLATDIFGRSGVDLLDVMGDLSGTGWQTNIDKANEFGLAMGGDTLNNNIEFGKQMETTKLSMQGLAVTIGSALMPFLTTLSNVVQQVVAWFQNLSPTTQTVILVVLGLVAAIGPLLMIIGSVISALGTIIPVITAVAGVISFPLIAIIAGLIAIVALLIAAWKNDWGGIRTTLTNIWNNNIKPIFDKLKEWLGVFIPKAIAVLKDFWDNVLLPAIKRVWAWITGTLLPLFSKLWTWLKTTLTTALQRLSDFWNNILLPAITKVWDFIKTKVLPIFEEIKTFIMGKFKEALEKIKEKWDKFKEGLEIIWDFIKNKVIPVFEDIWDWIKNKVQVAVEGLSKVLETLKGWWDKIKDAIQWVIDKIKAFIDILGNVKLPDWLSGKTTMKVGYELDKNLSTLSGTLGAPGLGTMSTASLTAGTPQTVNNFYLSANYKYQDEKSLAQDVKYLQALGRYT